MRTIRSEFAIYFIIFFNIKRIQQSKQALKRSLRVTRIEKLHLDGRHKGVRVQRSRDAQDTHQPASREHHHDHFAGYPVASFRDVSYSFPHSLLSIFSHFLLWLYCTCFHFHALFFFFVILVFSRHCFPKGNYCLFTLTWAWTQLTTFWRTSFLLGLLQWNVCLFITFENDSPFVIVQVFHDALRRCYNCNILLHWVVRNHSDAFH